MKKIKGIFLVFYALFFYWYIISEYIFLKNTEAELSFQSEQLKKEIAYIQINVNNLNEDIDYDLLESQARSNLALIHKDEEVYFWRD